MALRIITEKDPYEVKAITTVIYSLPGIGKTSTGCTADTPLLLDFDKGSYRSAFRKDSVIIESWEDIQNITSDDLKSFKSLVIDTPGRAVSMLAKHLIDEDPKNGAAGKLNQNGWGNLGISFRSWLDFVKNTGLDIVMLEHVSEGTNNKGEGKDRLDVGGKSGSEILKSSDAIAKLYLEAGKRKLNFNPHEADLGKNPAGLPVIEVPDFSTEPNFLGNVIRKIKASINSKTPEQQATAVILDSLIKKVSLARDPDGLNKAFDEVRESSASQFVKSACWIALKETSQAVGCEFCQSTKRFKKCG